MRRSVLLLVLALWAPALLAQVNVTFRYLPDLQGAATTPSSVFLPGEFNNWGPNSSGAIAATAPSRMTYDAARNEFRYTTTLAPRASAYQYKVNIGGASSGWLSDPLNPLVNASDNNNSQVFVTDPMVFQLAREQEGTSQIKAVSAGIFGTRPITALTFEVNGVAMNGLDSLNQTTRIFRYTLPTPIAPGSQFKVTATDDQNRTATATVGTILTTVTKAPRPAGIQDGVNYNPGDPTKVTLSLFAPGKSTVYAIGDFNNWTAGPAYQLKKDSIRADSVHFWTEISGLTPGQEYRFQYLIDGDLRLADLFAAKVYNPGEAGYPTGQTTQIVSTFQTGQTPYAWQVTNFQRPAPRDLVVYELIVRDFVAARNFDTLADTLGYLQKLGINAVELMPVSEFRSRNSWGYDPTFHLALEKDYGLASSFKRFVDEAHRRGIAVILDVVYNHAEDSSPLVRLYGGTAANRFLNVPATHPFSVFYDLDHTDPYVQYWLDRANRWWIDEYHVDGYRFDLAGGFMQTGNFIGYNAQRIALHKRHAAKLWQAHPTAYVILEDLIENTQEYRELTDAGMLVWINANGPFSQTTMGYPENANTSRAYFGAGGVGLNVPGSVSYMESHDEQWLMFKNRTYGQTSDTYSTRDLKTALDREKAAGAFFFTLPGPKMLWQFGELGYGGQSVFVNGTKVFADGEGECLVNGDYPGECPPGTPGRVDPKPIRWNYRSDPDRYRLYQTWAALINLRRSQPVFTDPATQVSLGVNGLVKRIGLRGTGADGQPLDVVIVGNFAVGMQAVAPAFTASGTWYDYFGRQSVNVTDPNALQMLAPGEFHVYTSRFVGYPAPNLVVGVEQTGEAPAATALGAVYPSPARGVAHVRYGVASAGRVTLEVFDVLGRRVRRALDADQPAGTYTADLDTEGLAAGTYVVRLSTGRVVQSRPLVVVE